jgi:hypothetical protein
MGRLTPKAVPRWTGPDVRRGGRDREKAGGRKGRERGEGKKLRGTGEDEPGRYKECAAFKKGRGKREGRAAHEEAYLPTNFIIYLFLSISHPYFQSPPIVDAGTLVLGPPLLLGHWCLFSHPAHTQEV